MPRALPLNPSGNQLGQENAVLSGTAARYHVPDFEGCLSLKCVMRGSACWETGGRRFILNADSYLILNDRQHYTITIEAREKATTFCLFFRRGFVEDVHRAMVTPQSALLDSPVTEGTLEFFNRLEPQDCPVLDRVRRFHGYVRSEQLTRDAWEQQFLAIAEQLVWERKETLGAIARLPAARAATRREVFRRLLRGRDFLLASLGEPIRLEEMASAACLSPFHFHRSFTRAFGETPHQYLTRQRLELAARQLRQSSRSVTEIGLAAGFETPASFSDRFRRKYGVSPRDYRRAI
jgi:AraC family transcriptional regulator